MPVPLHLIVALVCNYVVRRAERREQARVDSEARLRRERERGERLRREVEVDSMTGISNRRHLEGRLAEEIERTERLGEGFALLFADLDHFKAVNDEHGHVLGDDAPRLVARSLSENARQIDMVARYGGEDFVVLLPGTTPEGPPPSTSGPARTCWNAHGGSSGSRSAERGGCGLRERKERRCDPGRRRRCDVQGQAAGKGRYLRPGRMTLERPWAATLWRLAPSWRRQAGRRAPGGARRCPPGPWNRGPTQRARATR